MKQLFLFGVLGVVLAVATGLGVHLLTRETIALPVVKLEQGDGLAPAAARADATTARARTTTARRSTATTSTRASTRRTTAPEAPALPTTVDSPGPGEHAGSGESAGPGENSGSGSEDSSRGRGRGRSRDGPDD